MMAKLTRLVGLISEIDQRLQLLKSHAPNQESDHGLANVMNMYSEGPHFQR